MVLQEQHSWDYQQTTCFKLGPEYVQKVLNIHALLKRVRLEVELATIMFRIRQDVCNQDSHPAR